MVKNDTSWLQEDNSWRKTTCHGAGKIPLAEAIAFVNSWVGHIGMESISMRKQTRQVTFT